MSLADFLHKAMDALSLRLLEKRLDEVRLRKGNRSSAPRDNSSGPSSPNTESTETESS